MLVGTIDTIMTRDVISIDSDETVDKAAKLMKDHGIANVIVVEPEEKPVGIITQRDILLRVTVEGGDATKIKVNEVMTSPLITTKSDTTLLDAIKTMYQKNVRRLPIVDGEGKLIGIVTYRDVLGILLTRLVPFLVK